MTRRGQRSRDIPLLQWVVSGIGAALLLGMVVFLALHAVRGTDTGPDITVDVEQIVRVTGGYRVEVRVRNRGDGAAQDVVVQGRLGGGEAAEESEVTVDFVPAGSERMAGLLFSADPSAGSLDVRAAGYVKP